MWKRGTTAATGDSSGRGGARDDRAKVLHGRDAQSAWEFPSADARHSGIELRDSFDPEQYAAVAFTHAPHPMVMIDATHDRVVACNRAFARLVSVPAEQLVGRGMSELYADEEQTRLRVLVDEADRKGDVTYDAKLRQRTNGSIAVRVELASVREGGRVTSRIATFTRQSFEHESVLRSQKLETLGTLAAGVAHDFNNILQGISGNLRLALEDLGEHPVSPLLRDVAHGTARAAGLVRQILDFSKPQETSAETLVLVDAVKDALQLVRATLPASIQIRLRVEDGVPRVCADPTQLHQVFVNLATNAAHAIGGRVGVIEVALERVSLDGQLSLTLPRLPEGDYARVSIRDNGIGMDSATQARVFDPFFTTKPIGQGTGLGLSVVQGIMRGLGGQVTVSSTLGQGTTFCLYFPALLEEESSQVKPAPRAARGQGQCVLFVDDEYGLSRLGKRMLERLGYRAECFSDPVAALAALRQRPQRYAALVTDLSMPAMNGFELSQAVRGIRSDLPVIMMSGFVAPEERERAMRSGIRDLIVKPVSIETLGSALGTILGDSPR